MRSFRLVLKVMKCVPRKAKPLPCRLGSLGLMVATSRLGSASAAMGGTGGGGVGMVHSVSGVARVSVSGSGFGPWLQLPSIVFPSPLSLPSNEPPIILIFIFTVEPSSVMVSTGQWLTALIDAVEDGLVSALIVFGDFHNSAQICSPACSVPCQVSAMSLGLGAALGAAAGAGVCAAGAGAACAHARCAVTNPAAHPAHTTAKAGNALRQNPRLPTICSFLT